MDLIFSKTRFAPTPSGLLHLGNIYSFAVTAALAQKTGARIFLRIDDFDMERTNRAYVQDIFDTLNFLEIPWHDGPRTLQEYEDRFSLRHRLPLYYGALEKLKESGALFACTCTRTDLHRLSPESIYTGTCVHKNIPLNTPNVSWRLETSAARHLEIKTLTGLQIIETIPQSMTDFIVRKKDGFPAYQLISLIDDVYFGVDLVVRGDDLWPSTMAQVYLSDYLGEGNFQKITFYHHPLLNSSDGHKLSKSAGDVSVNSLRHQFHEPSDIFRMLATATNLDFEPQNWQQLIDGLGTLIFSRQ